MSRRGLRDWGPQGPSKGDPSEKGSRLRRRKQDPIYNKYRMQDDPFYIQYRSMAPKKEREGVTQAKYKKTLMYHQMQVSYSPSYRKWVKSKGRIDNYDLRDIVSEYMDTQQYRDSKQYDESFSTVTEADKRTMNSAGYKMWLNRQTAYYKVGKSDRRLIFEFEGDQGKQGPINYGPRQPDPPGFQAYYNKEASIYIENRQTLPPRKFFLDKYNRELDAKDKQEKSGAGPVPQGPPKDEVFENWYRKKRKTAPTLSRSSAIILYRIENQYTSDDPEFEKWWQRSSDSYKRGEGPVYTKMELHNTWLTDKNRKLPQWRAMENLYKKRNGEDKWNKMSPTQRKAWYDENPDLVSRFNKIGDNPDSGNKFSPGSQPKTFNTFDEWLAYHYPSVDQSNTTPEIMDMLRTKYAMYQEEQRNKNPTEPTKPTEPATKPTGPTKPTEPATKPTGPTKPTEPATKPTGPTKPTEPTTKPTEPAKQPEKKKPEGVPTIPVPPDHTFDKGKGGNKTNDKDKKKKKPKGTHDLTQKQQDMINNWDAHRHGNQNIGDAYHTWYKSKNKGPVDPNSDAYQQGMLDWLTDGAPAPDGYIYQNKGSKKKNSGLVSQAPTSDMPFVFVSFV